MTLLVALHLHSLVQISPASTKSRSSSCFYVLLYSYVMPSNYKDFWERLFVQKKQELLENDCEESLQIESFDDFQLVLHDIGTSYNQGKFPDFLSALNPSLNHLQSFINAITSASQYQPAACLFWGTMQALILVRLIIPS